MRTAAALSTAVCVLFMSEQATAEVVIPFSQSIEREARRLADAHISRLTDTQPPPTSQSAASHGDWSQVMKLRPDARIRVRANGADCGVCYFVRADEQSLVVLVARPSSRATEQLARSEVTEVLRYPGAAGTFWGDFGGLFVIGSAIAGTVVGAMAGDRGFDRHPKVGRLLGGFVGSVGGIAVGLAIFHTGAGSEPTVIYRTL